MRVLSSRARSTLIWIALIGLFALVEWRIPAGEDLEEGPEQGSFLSHPSMAAGVHSSGSVRK
jgi:hypothetical protein